MFTYLKIAMVAIVLAGIGGAYIYVKNFRDEKNIKRSVSKIAWHPEGVSKLAVGYAI